MKQLFAFLFFFLVFGTTHAQKIERWKVGDLLDYAKQSDSALIINFWATWCVPCIEELPYFHTLAEKYKDRKVKLLLVSVDFENFYPDGISKFARSRNFTAQIVWLDEEKPDYFCPLVDPKWSGAVPATLFINPKAGYRSFRESQLKPEEVEDEIKKMLNSK